MPPGPSTKQASVDSDCQAGVRRTSFRLAVTSALLTWQSVAAERHPSDASRSAVTWSCWSSAVTTKAPPFYGWGLFLSGLWARRMRLQCYSWPACWSSGSVALVVARPVGEFGEVDEGAAVAVVAVVGECAAAEALAEGSGPDAAVSGGGVYVGDHGSHGTMMHLPFQVSGGARSIAAPD